MNTSTKFLTLRLQAADLQQEWERCSLLANYVGQSTSYEFAQHEYAENLIATVVNEALEVVVNLATADSGLSLEINPRDNRLAISVCFTSQAALRTEFVALLQKLQQNSQEMYFDLLTQQSTSEHHINGLGLAMLMHDFGAEITVSHVTTNENQLCVLIQVSDQEFTL